MAARTYRWIAVAAVVAVADVVDVVFVVVARLLRCSRPSHCLCAHRYHWASHH